MAPEEFLESPPKSVNILPVHLDVQNHMILGSTFASAVTATEQISKAIIDVHLNGDAVLQVYLLPAEQGSFLGKLALVVNIGVGAITIQGHDDFAKLVEGFTGGPYDSGRTMQNLGERLKDAAGGFLSIENEVCKNIVKDNPRFDKAFNAKSDFIESCSRSNDVNGIGFSQRSTFPIRRADFVKHISKPIVRVKPTEVFHVYGHVLSPVLLANESKPWALKATHINMTQLKKPKTLSATMTDRDFLMDFFAGRHPVKISSSPDLMEAEVQVSQITEDGEITKRPVKEIRKVIFFNGERLVPENYSFDYSQTLKSERDDMFSGLDDDGEGGVRTPSLK